MASTGLIGCHSTAPVGTLDTANLAYQSGDYPMAYHIASTIASGDPQLDSDEAAYLAGLSAGELGDLKNAIRYLTQASKSFDKQLAANAGVMLGLAYTNAERYGPAADALLKAAPVLTGEERAKAYFYAAVAQQKLGRWASAHDNLILAQVSSTDPELRGLITQRLAVIGYTIQIGSFADAANAQDAAEQITEAAAAAGVAPPRLLPNPARPGQTLVHVGRFTTYQSAITYRDQLGLPGAFVVPLASENAP